MRGNFTVSKATKTMAGNFLANVPEEKIFWSHDGQLFQNLNELAAGLSIMPDENYTYHVDGGKNDFAKWVKEVIGDEELATSLQKAMSRPEASKKVMDRVSYLSFIK